MIKILKRLKMVLSRGDDRLRFYEKLGHSYNLMGNYDLAIEAFNKVVKLNPNRPDPYHELGNMHKMKGLYDEAISNYKKALEINPDRQVSIDGIHECTVRKEFKRIDTYIHVKNYELALRELKEILEKEGDNLHVHEKLAHLYGAMGEYELAIEAFNKVMKLDTKREDIHYQVITMYIYKMKSLCSEPSPDRNKITEIHKELMKLNVMNKDIRIKYLLVKAELYKDHKDCIEKCEDLRHIASDIYKGISAGNYNADDEKSVLKLLADDFLLEAGHFRSKGKDAIAILRYRKALSIDPDNKKAKEGLYFAEKFLHSSEKPHFCAVSIVFRCMLRCRMCRIWENNVVDELSIESWKGIIDELAGFMDENRTINFAGGEPLLKDGLIDLINYSHKKGFKPAICTNGWLIDEEMAKRLVDSGIDIVAISLDSLNEKTHDYLRGIEGSYEKVMDAIGYLNKYNKDNRIRIHVQPIISEVNLEDLIELTHWANRHEGIGDITFLAIIQPPHTDSDYQEWYKKEEFKMLWPQDKNKIDSVMDELIRLKIKDKVRSYKIGNQVFQMEAYKEYFKDPLKFYKKKIQCNIGTQFVNIHTNGDMKLCHYSDITIGNAAKERIGDIWNSMLANSVRNKIKACNRKCHQILNCMKDENPYIKNDKTDSG